MAPPRSRGSTQNVVMNRAASLGSPAFAGIDLKAEAHAPKCVGLPRVRGDRPARPAGDCRCRAAPPRSRGSTRFQIIKTPSSCGSPAFAGIDPRTRPEPTPDNGLPRVRGDRPCRLDGAKPSGWAPPRSRGSTRSRVGFVELGSGSPAFAGIDLGSRSASEPGAGLPRVRGDRPSPRRKTVRSITAPPRSRGSTLPPSQYGALTSGSPAFAGIDPRPRASCRRPSRLPRVRGDRP